MVGIGTLLVGLALAQGPSPEQALEISVTVEEPAGIARRDAPVTGGICLPSRTLRADQGFELLDGERSLPLQTTPLVVDGEGFLRWVLLDFLLTIEAGARKTLALRTSRLPPEAGGASSSEMAPRLEVEDDASGVSVRTGRLTFQVLRGAPFRVFGSVAVGGQTVAQGDAVDVVEAATGRRYVAGAPERVSLEYRGPIRVTVRVDGRFVSEAGDDDDRGLRYTTRLTAWAGNSSVRIEHILANSSPTRVEYWNIREASIQLRHALPRADGLGGAEGLRGTLDRDGSLWLHQGKVHRYYNEPIPDAARGGLGEKTTWSGADSGGWIALSTPERTVVACDRDFVGDPPRRLEVDRETLKVAYVSSRFDEGRGVPFESDRLWLYDLSHKVAEVWIDFDASQDPSSFARAARGRLLAFASPQWYSECDVLAVGRFGTLEDEKSAYRTWGWSFRDEQLPRSEHRPHAFVRWEDNHYESEADSAEALLLMALRTGQRGFFDVGEAWARYHANLHAWRTDGWRYDDGAIWFPQGGPQGTRLEREPSKREYEKWGKGSGDDKELWHLVQAKSCYCHFYGAGLIDHFCLTGSRDSLEAAIDLVEQKSSEFRKHRQFTPGKSTISDTRGFGRGFYVITRLLEVLPRDEFVGDLARLCRDVLWSAPDMDERGFAPCHIGTGFGGFDPKNHIPQGMREFMEQSSITIDDRGWLSDSTGRTWPVVCLGGTWQHAYVQAAAYRYATTTGDEDLADFSEAFGRFAARYLLSEKCKQTHYYTYMDVPEKGKAWDPWKFEPEHIATTDGEGCVHSGWYTRFFPDAMAIAFSLSGDRELLSRAREFWHYGSKRRYQTKGLAAGWDEVLQFSGHVPPKDDSVLSTCRMLYAWSHLPEDAEGPEPIRDLTVVLEDGGRATVRFTAPRDRGGGRVVRYRVKCATLPIVAYDDYDFGRDDGVRRNFWRADNVLGESEPSSAGRPESFVVEAVPSGDRLYFVVVSHDGAGNRSPLSNLAATSR